MPVKPIVTMGNPVLVYKAEAVEDPTASEIRDLDSGPDLSDIPVRW